MDEAQMMVLELAGKGYSCAQMVIIGGLRLMGRENPDLVRAMAGLAQGVGYSGEVCGALAGGCCLLGLHTGKGDDSESPLPEAVPLMDSLAAWFLAELCNGAGLTCDSILGIGDGQRQGMDPMRCGELVAKTWTRTVSLLAENGIDPSLGRDLP